MRLGVATRADLAQVQKLWHLPDNLNFIDPADPEEIADTIAEGHVLLWQNDDEVIGFASFMRWLPRVYGLRAFAVTKRGQGRPFLHASLDHAFGNWNAHRIGLDVTGDNQRGRRLFEAAGFVHEGIFRQCWQREDGDWVDCHFMAMLATDPRP